MFTKSFTQSMLILAILAVATACQSHEVARLQVTATAYTSSPEQTNAQPNLGAWGDNLQPGMKAIAVSRDLLELGLERGSEVKIEGLPGHYLVLDKMHKRWERKIDIYMGNDLERAIEWGKQQVVITWTAS